VVESYIPGREITVAMLGEEALRWLKYARYMAFMIMNVNIPVA
jgi:hypothetical protein